MKNISEIDSNFAVQSCLAVDNIKLYNVQEEPFSVYGVFYENGSFRRLPEAVAKQISPGVCALHTHTAGGRVKFVTDSPYVAIRASVSGIEKVSHFTLTGIAGYDLYVGKEEEYYASFVPPVDIADEFEGIVHFDSTAIREITINFPLYSCISQLYIGLDKNAELKKSAGYKYNKPIVYYGSSITQGGCASRPGNSYESQISREMQIDHINLGFSGNARGEAEIAQYISTLDMSAFVYDYDHNAPTLQHLKDTHEKMFRIIREKNPKLPIILMSRPKYRLNDEERLHLGVIRKTYDDAVAAGDDHVYFIDGPSLMNYAKNDGTVDKCHPNDLGFYSIAMALLPKLQDCICSE